VSGRRARRQRRANAPVPHTLYVLEVPEPSDTLAVKRTRQAVFVAPIGTPPPTAGEPLPEGWREIGVTE
jgi:hypothetical protein